MRNGKLNARDLEYLKKKQQQREERAVGSGKLKARDLDYFKSYKKKKEQWAMEN